MNDNTRYLYLDTSIQDADWPKQRFDLPRVKTLKDLASFLDLSQDSPEFRLWLAQANNYPWVDDAPSEIRLAIRAHLTYPS